MAVMRTTQSAATLHRNLVAGRLHRNRGTIHVRNLWWWGRRDRSSQSYVDDMEERLRRHHALMMHRYTKAVRRRALWERDGSPRYYGWGHLRCRMRGMSSTEPLRAKVEEPKSKDTTPPDAWQEYHKNFESFKKAVDQAIERDPYGTLFGRRWRGPDTGNNSAWTAWSRIFDPSQIKEEPKVESQTQSPNRAPESATVRSAPIKEHSTATGTQPSVEHSSSSSKTTTTIRSSRSIVFQNSSSATTEYIYDPISGRKVPPSISATIPMQSTTSTFETQTSTPHKSTTSRNEPIEPKQTIAISTPKTSASTIQVTSLPKSNHTSEQKPLQSEKRKVEPKGFLETMFGEHGVDIPVKTYKPHKVYGYTGDPKSSSKAEDSSGRGIKGSPENSRKHEYEQLRLRTLGNNIDATNFSCEPWNAKNEDNLPVYDAAKSLQVEEPVTKKARTAPAPDEDVPLFSGTTYETKKDEIAARTGDWLAKEGFRTRQGMTIPSLRTEQSPNTGTALPAERMQPALDRAQRTTSTEIPVKKFGTRLQPAVDRVTTRSRLASTSENNVMLAQSPKEAEVQKLEKHEDIDLLRASDIRAASKVARMTKQDMEEKKRQDRKDFEKDYEARGRTDHSIDVSDKSPSQSVYASNMNNVWNHIKQHPNGIVAKTMQNLGLTASDKKIAQPAVIPAVSQKETSLVPNVSTATIQATSTSDKQLQRLGAEIKSIYEQHNGKIDDRALSLAEARPAKRASFAEPTVKAGVVRDLDMERHTQTFEPKLADIVDKAKAVKRALQVVEVETDLVRKSRTDAAAEQPPARAEPAMPPTHEQARPAAALAEDAEVDETFEAPMIVLRREGSKVQLEPYHDTFVTEKLKIHNFTKFLASLPNPGSLLEHFPKLDKMGYELTHGDESDLFFKKRGLIEIAKPDRASMRKNLGRKIAAEEAAAQPNSPPTVSRSAANVLDEIPSSIPSPGPAPSTAPTAGVSQQPATPSQPSVQPTSASIPQPEAQAESTSQQPRKKSRSPRVSRQEQVFSGQQRLKPQTTSLPDPEHFQKQNPITSSANSYQYQQDSEPRLSWFARFRRFVKRTILTGLAFGAGAYGIGVIAEALHVKAQIAQGDTGGPMKRLVMDSEARKQGERQRAGIFSTESSR
ncbi:hypothetical protein LTR05_004405 [Lithohypha guttulata]|uniref:Uncharacterized protein n=1 Tax=Lithohypha guttulata TaxID=1690604 RepID=A0AAN7T2R5_9EURO|nr:hypothetical protein LTR05_004405 [Lithohypha guttulata]